MVLDDYDKKRKMLEAAERKLRKAASDKIGKLIEKLPGQPRWTLEAIGQRVGLSKAAVSKIRAKHEDISIESVRKILEADF